jgi:hypothetical protein
MAFKATEVRLDPETRTKLEGWVRASSTEQRYVRRARIVLLVNRRGIFTVPFSGGDPATVSEFTASRFPLSFNGPRSPPSASPAKHAPPTAPSPKMTINPPGETVRASQSRQEEGQMIVKAIEIRDRNTFIPAIAISTAPANEGQRYLLRGAG